MKRNFVLVILILFIGQFAFAQTSNQKQEPRYIQVSGYAEMEVIPNEVYIGILLHEYMKDKNTKVTMNMLEKDLATVLKKAGLSKDDLKLNTLNADLQKFHKRRDEDVFAKTLYQLKITDMSKLGPFMEAIGETDIKNVFVEELDHSDIENLELQVEVDAVKNAKKKADALLNAAGEKTGKVLYIDETAISYRRNYKKADVINYLDGDIESFNLSSEEFKPIILNCTITIRYAIQE